MTLTRRMLSRITISRRGIAAFQSLCSTLDSGELISVSASHELGDAGRSRDQFDDDTIVVAIEAKSGRKGRVIKALPGWLLPEEDRKH